MRRRTLTAFVLATAVALGALAGASAASASTTPTVTADPSTVTVGGIVTVTATGLGGLETASFGLDDTSGVAMISDPASGEASTLVQTAVTDGAAAVIFSASQAGTFTVAVGDGETVLAQTTVTVVEQPASTVTVTADPSTLDVGATSTITVTGLGGLESASFGLDDNAAGTFSADGSAGASPADVPVTDGEATAVFTAAQDGFYTIAIGDGETVLGTVIVTIGDPTTVVETPTPISAPEEGAAGAGAPGWLVGLLIAGGVVLLALIVTIVVLALRRRAARDAA